MENITQITVKDLDSLRAIVDLAAQRGAFRGEELSQVGEVYDKLTTFLNAVLAQVQASAETVNGETATSDSTVQANAQITTQGD
jgi:hypothetical protein